MANIRSWIYGTFSESDDRLGLHRRPSGLVSGEDVSGDMAGCEEACEQCDRGQKAASIGNTGFLEGPGCHSQKSTTTGTVATPLVQPRVKTLTARWPSPCRPKASNVFW